MSSPFHRELPEAVENVVHVDFSSAPNRALRDLMRTPSVFEQLNITFTRDQWAAMNVKAGTDYQYPFADVVQIHQPKEA